MEGLNRLLSFGVVCIGLIVMRFGYNPNRHDFFADMNWPLGAKIFTPPVLAMIFVALTAKQFRNTNGMLWVFSVVGLISLLIATN